jgi:hypothetical protein
LSGARPRVQTACPMAKHPSVDRCPRSIAF